MTSRILVGDCQGLLPTLPAECVQTVVTSPPYWSLRDYGVDGQLGLEATPSEYVADLVAIFREVRRVLRRDGTVWLNLGDTYAGSGRGPTGKNGFQNAETRQGFTGEGRKRLEGRANGTVLAGVQSRSKASLAAGETTPGSAWVPAPPGFKAKDLMLLPARVAIALQEDGWYVRSDIIWHKPNPLPESVVDRPTRAHEYIYLLSKSRRYFYDATAIQLPAAESMQARAYLGERAAGPRQTALEANGTHGEGGRLRVYDRDMVNRRSVWTVPIGGFTGAHFATFPPDLVIPCVLAGTSQMGCCPECLAPWRRIREPSAEYAASLGTSWHDHAADTVQGNRITTRKARADYLTIGWEPSCRHSTAVDPIPCTVLDPFAGAGTTLLVADRLGRDAIGIELNPEYVELARMRLADDAAPLFAEVAVS